MAQDSSNILLTARKHFEDDIKRATSLRKCTKVQTDVGLTDDILRASWMMAVGAADAYFCDAYGDLISRTLRAIELQPEITIPDRLMKLRIPVVAVVQGGQDGWRWRMASRELIEDESVLSLNKIRELFGQFFSSRSKRVLRHDTIKPWLMHQDARVRCFGITPAKYRNLSQKRQKQARSEAMKKFEGRFEMIFQHRHDCIHNCDRPKVKPQPIAAETVRKIAEDIQFLVTRMHETLREEFPTYLKHLGFSGVTRNRVIV